MYAHRTARLKASLQSLWSLSTYAALHPGLVLRAGPSCPRCSPHVFDQRCASRVVLVLVLCLSCVWWRSVCVVVFVVVVVVSVWLRRSFGHHGVSDVTRGALCGCAQGFSLFVGLSWVLNLLISLTTLTLIGTAYWASLTITRPLAPPPPPTPHCAQWLDSCVVPLPRCAWLVSEQTHLVAARLRRIASPVWRCCS